MNCQICGKNSMFFELCKEHNDMKATGQVVKNEKTGKWELNNKTSENKDSKCIVCGAEAPHGPQCKACYYETLEYKTQLDRNNTLAETNKHYRNLCGNLYRMINIDNVKTNCNKLIALAMIAQDIFNSGTLFTKVFEDVEKIISIKTKITPKEESVKKANKEDSQQENIYSTIDGHTVKSLGERIIDDLLYNNTILHTYSPTVDEIDIKEEESIEADWFIPIKSANKGIYIEYWGMTSEKYLQNKERKKAQYAKNNIPVIYIEKNEPFEDINALRINIIQQIKELARKYYNIQTVSWEI